MTAPDYFYKRITDPIHGNIGLSKLESEVASSRVFQRLHSVRQLGLAHLVFPGANYSRFSHSIGACHNASRLLTAIQRNSASFEIKPERVQLYRLVGLLHDVGHYPFSHATEHVVANYYAKQFISNDASQNSLFGDEDPAPEPNTPLSYGHEELGELIIRTDAELREIFSRHGVEPDDVADIFAGKKPDSLIGIISSDLDCDRLDYLRRTAHYSGAPYGSVDIDFIIDQAMVDGQGRFCLHPKALRAADHLLVSRYYDYMQVPYNKTVAALEWSLVTCLRALLIQEEIDCSGRAVRKKVIDSTWCNFDDQDIFEKFKKLLSEISAKSDRESEILKDHLRGILHRSPSKMIAAWEEIQPIVETRSAGHMARLAEAGRKEIIETLAVDGDRLHIWNLPLKLSKIGNSSTLSENSEDEIAEAIYILNTETEIADVLNVHKETLLHRLGNYRYVGLRLYYLPPYGQIDDALHRSMRTIMVKHLDAPSS